MEFIVEHAWLLDLENLTSDLSFVVFIIIIIIIIYVYVFFLCFVPHISAKSFILDLIYVI